MSEPTRAEQYVASKNWPYSISGNQLVLKCPYCGGDKFYINKDTFLWDCKKGSCGKSGNEKQLLTDMGDFIPGVMTQAGPAKREAIPNIEQCHQWLLENDAWMNWLNDERGWSEATVRKMKLGLSTHYVREVDATVPCLMYPYFAGTICNFVKFRTLPPTKKGFAAIQGWDSQLYNQNSVKKGMDYLVLTEGERDCCSLLELGEENAAGVPGASNRKAVWDHLLDLPKKIYLVFDNDEAGQTGAASFAKRFGIEKFYNVVVPEETMSEPIGDRTTTKDLSEWILQGHTLEDFQSLLKTAKAYDIDGVSTMEASLEDVITEMRRTDGKLFTYDTPWPSLNRCMGGANDGHLVIIQAPKKTGKTTVALNWADYLVEHNGVVGFFECFEMPALDLARKWASFITKTDDTPDAEGKSALSETAIRAAQEIARGRDAELLFGYYPQIKKLDEEFDRLRAVVRRYGVKFIVLDNLQLFVKLIHNYNMGPRHEMISKVTGMLKMLSMELNILIILLTQSKRLDEDVVADAESLDGSGAPGADCDIMMVMNRTKVANIKKLSDLASMGNVQTSENFAPELYIKTDLTRRSPGGWATLYLEGGMSWVRERTTAEEGNASLKEMANGIPFEKEVSATEKLEEEVQAI
jgi:hypothetical protein